MRAGIPADGVLFFESQDFGCEIVVRHFVIGTDFAQKFVDFQDFTVL
jgi:hypothetical protein